MKPEFQLKRRSRLQRSGLLRVLSPGTAREKGLLAKMYAYYDARGFTGNSLALTAILGREPRRFRNYIGELALRGSQDMSQKSDVGA